MNDGGSCVIVPVLVPVAHVFGAESDGPFDIYEIGGTRYFKVSFSQLDAMLRGLCHTCGEAVDHLREVKLGDDDRVPIEIALSPSDPTDPARIKGVGEAIAAGWNIGQVCDECRTEVIRDRLHRRSPNEP